MGVYFCPMSMDDKIERLRRIKEKALLGGGEEKLEKQHEKGKLSARERIDRLLDPGSLMEFDPLATTRSAEFGMDGKRFHGDGLVSGFGEIHGRKVCVFAQDFTVLGGSIGAAHGRKMCETVDWARKRGVPVVGLFDSAGARIQEGWSGGRDGGSLFLPNTLASGIVPQIAVIMGPCAGISVYSPALMDFVFMVDGISYMHITGPRVIESVTGEQFTSEQLGGARVHTRVTGCAHFALPDEAQCLESVRRLLAFLPQNHLEEAPVARDIDDPEREDEGLASVVPEDGRKSYDVREVIRRVCDHGDFMEVHEEFAPNLVAGFARLGRRTVGVIANQPMIMGGALTVDASDKCARFVRFCDCFNIPLVYFADVPGYLPGVEQEHAGIIRHGAKMLYAYCEATVPKITVALRKGYGGGILAMGGNKGLGADLILAWPTAEIAVVGAEAAVDLLMAKEIKEAKDPEAMRREKIQWYRDTFGDPIKNAELGLADDVIEPSQTRKVLIKHLDFMRGKKEPRPRKKHGNIPM